MSGHFSWLGDALVLPWRSSVSWLPLPRQDGISSSFDSQIPDCLCTSQSSWKPVLAKSQRSVTSPLCGTLLEVL